MSKSNHGEIWLFIFACMNAKKSVEIIWLKRLKPWGGGLLRGSLIRRNFGRAGTTLWGSKRAHATGSCFGIGWDKVRVRVRMKCWANVRFGGRVKMKVGVWIESKRPEKNPPHSKFRLCNFCQSRITSKPCDSEMGNKSRLSRLRGQK